MTHAVCVKLAPVLTAERWDDPNWTRPERTFYWPGSLRLLPGKPTPLVVDHDMSRVIGTVHELLTMPWVDGPWIVARGIVDDPPGWLSTYQTKASFGRWDVHATTHANGWERVTSAIVKEVWLLAALEPAEPLAQVVLLQRSTATSSTPTTRASAMLADGVIHLRPVPPSADRADRYSASGDQPDNTTRPRALRPVQRRQ